MLSEQGPLVVTTTKSSRNHTARSDFLLLFCFLGKDEFVFKTRRKGKKGRKEKRNSITQQTAIN